MITQARRQLIQRRLSRARTLAGRFTVPLVRYRRSARWRASASAWHQLRRVSVRRISRPAELAIELVPYDRAYEEGFEDMQRRVPDLQKLRGLTGYEPRVHLDEILDRVVAYFTSDATRL